MDSIVRFLIGMLLAGSLIGLGSDVNAAPAASRFVMLQQTAEPATETPQEESTDADEAEQEDEPADSEPAPADNEPADDGDSPTPPGDLPANEEKPKSDPSSDVEDDEAESELDLDDSNDEDQTEVVADIEPESLDFLFSGKSPESIEQLQTMERHFANLSQQVAPATVNIQIGMAQGSGVVVSSDGYILTAAHVIGRPNLTAKITFPDGKEVDATTLGLHRRLDFGMLKITDEEVGSFPNLEVGLSSELKDGQWVMAIGHPGGIDEKRGLVFRVGRIIDNSMDKLQTDCTLVGGDSGGPLVDMNGEVIGIHSRIGSKLWDNLHAPIDLYSDNWDRMDQGIVLEGTPFLGFEVKPKTNRVIKIEKGGPADKAGIKPQDRIIKVDDRETPNFKQLGIAIARLLPYQKSVFTIKRRSKTLTLEVVVGEDQ